MTLEDIRKYFGSSYNFNKITGMKHTNYINWKKWGFIPIKTQFKLEKFTNGELKANIDDLRCQKESIN